jgi:pimeloyl-ACP methyl ester carboxylesterase
MKLRLYHHSDGTRIAYREIGTGPPLAILHSAMLTYMEWEPLVEHLSDRFRLVLPDLPLHGDSEARPRHAYTPDWFADVLAGFAADALGPRPLLAGHDLGAEIVMHAVASGRVSPSRIVLMPNRMHRRASHPALRRLWRVAARTGSVPGIDRLASHAVRAILRPELGLRLTARESPAAVDLIRHAFADVGGNADLARSWARFARRWPSGPQRQPLDAYSRIQCPVLLLWADSDPAYGLDIAEEALEMLPRAQLRVLEGTGYLVAYDDPVGVARELAAFCG